MGASFLIGYSNFEFNVDTVELQRTKLVFFSTIKHNLDFHNKAWDLTTVFVKTKHNFKKKNSLRITNTAEFSKIVGEYSCIKAYFWHFFLYN